ncbi:hypothetical protein FNV43_RR08710 [Rhamnella rubrinervis]|uniref:Myb/SANT-like domain-containing protein n=1 Tax=Rhamnella rubrinervis TaxID=2594499 RepID=A0A8K0H8T8_9ROSA|nr:hypothetical protein FNV43_RR08710 [Rhamnella rubrinervis]
MTLKEVSFAVTDVNGNVMFKIKGSVFSIHDRRVLLDAADNPIISFQQKHIGDGMHSEEIAQTPKIYCSASRNHQCFNSRPNRTCSWLLTLNKMFSISKSKGVGLEGHAPFMLRMAPPSLLKYGSKEAYYDVHYKRVRDGKVFYLMDRRTLGILCELLHHDDAIKKDGLVTLEELEETNCLGALDSTYIRVHVPEIDKLRYRTRKGEIVANVLGVCSKNMEFIFVLPGWESSVVLPGWESSASDSRVLRDAISRPNELRVPSGYYYLVDAGYTNGMRSRHVWTREEEEALLDKLDDVVTRDQRCDTGSFKAGTMTMIERSLAQKCPELGLKINPHIESKLKKWKKQYRIVCDILSKSGFGWNDTLKCVEVDSNEAWKAYIEAEGWRGKSFPIYDKLLNIFGKDRATGKASQVTEDMTNDMNLDEKNEAIEIEDLPSPMNVNQSLNSVTQSVRKRKGKSHIDIIAGFSEVSEKMCLSFQQAAK